MQRTHATGRWMAWVVAAVLALLLGLALALTGSGGPLGSNKADAYGTSQPPKTPTTLGACKQQFGSSDGRAACIATVLRTRARARCASKPRSRRAACRTAANTAHRRNTTKGRACLRTFKNALPQLPANPTDAQLEAYNAAARAAGAALERCFAKIR